MHAHTICLQCTTEANSDNLATVGGTGTLTTPTTVTTPPGNTDKSHPTPSGPQGSSTDHANMQLDGKYVCM